MWDLIVSVPDHCLSFYFSSKICSYQPLLFIHAFSYEEGASTADQ